ncbi:MAG: lysophospholipid acyltransferase family protein [Polyangiales bacterium]
MRRRLITIPALLLVAAVVTSAAPLWVPALLVIGFIRQRHLIALRLSLFVLVYSWMELFGVLVMTGAWILRQSDNQAFHYRLQRLWANTLFRAMQRLLQLRFVVEGQEAFEKGPFLLLMRHTSIADTVLPAALLCGSGDFRLRYVLKKELRADPCLDLAGGRLPNHFIDRARVDEQELKSIADLAQDLSDNEGVLIYPEGTRYSVGVRERVLKKLRASGSSRLGVAEELKHTLLPKVRGVAALRGAAPDVDVVLFAHRGFEGFATMTSMLSGELVGQTVHARFWRRDASTLGAEVATWLDEEWRRVDAYAASFDENEPLEVNAEAARTKDSSRRSA